MSLDRIVLGFIAICLLGGWGYCYYCVPHFADRIHRVIRRGRRRATRTDRG
jgi:hypothetical protein